MFDRLYEYMKYVRSHSVCIDPFILLELFFKLLNKILWIVTFFRGSLNVICAVTRYTYWPDRS